MEQRFFTLLLLLTTMLAAWSCKNKELAAEDPCDPSVSGWSVLVRVNWDDHERDSRHMRMSLFSQNHHPHMDRESVDHTGLKRITVPADCHYMPVCYDYNANNIYFRNETDHGSVEAYSMSSSRSTYRSRATPVDGESTVSEASSFHLHAWTEEEEGAFRIFGAPEDGTEHVIDFYPKDVMREFTFCIRNVIGANNISESRGAASGMAASIFLATGALNPERSTVLFEGATATNAEVGEITGRFYTFGPLEPYSNRFTIEVLSRGSQYYTAYWNVSDQITESMADREDKLARDGYDILIMNDPNGGLPPIIPPGGPNPGSGFDIDVDEWDNVVIYL